METILDNTKRSKDVLIAFAVLAAIDVLSIILGLYQNNALSDYDSGGGVTDEDIEMLDSLTMGLGIIQFICIIVVIVLFIKWFRRAYGNLIRLQVPMEYNESKAVWGYFIPFINWIRPIKTAKEIFIKTQEAIKTYEASLSIDRNTGFISIWWIVYIADGVIGNFASRSMQDATTIDRFIEANNVYIFSDVWDILSIGLAILVIQKISKLELILKNTDTSTSLIDQIGTSKLD